VDPAPHSTEAEEAERKRLAKETRQRLANEAAAVENERVRQACLKAGSPCCYCKKEKNGQFPYECFNTKFGVCKSCVSFYWTVDGQNRYCCFEKECLVQCNSDRRGSDYVYINLLPPKKR
jgi:hypothetical protein